MDYLPPVACVELSADRYFICLIDINGAAELPRQLGGWTVERDDHELLSTLLAGRYLTNATDEEMGEVDHTGIAGYFTPEESLGRIQAEITALKKRFESVRDSPTRHGLGLLTEPRWPDLDWLTSRPIDPQTSCTGQGRDAFVLGVKIKNLANEWGRLESIRLTASYPLPRDPASPKSRPREFRYYLTDHSIPNARPLPVVDQ